MRLKPGDWVVVIPFDDWVAYLRKTTPLNVTLGSYEELRLDHHGLAFGKPIMITAVEWQRNPGSEPHQLVSIDPLFKNPILTADIFRKLKDDELALARLLFDDRRSHLGT